MPDHLDTHPDTPPEENAGQEDETLTARRAAMDLLARREHSRAELLRKLTRRVSQDSAQIAIDRLSEEGLQSDERFAESYVRQRAERGVGPLRLGQELRERGVDEGLAREAISGSGFDWNEVATAALEKKFGSAEPPEALKEKARMLRFAAYRGFERDHLPPGF
jgi:regulatory protein